ncbi:MAG: hypothetical protein ABEH81_01165 [Halopenitus sp.]
MTVRVGGEEYEASPDMDNSEMVEMIKNLEFEGKKVMQVAIEAGIASEEDFPEFQ